MESIWSKTCNLKPRETLHGNVKTEIAVIGAGMAGILIAYQLQQAGKEVILLEADRIASGQTKNTTAKITSQHGMSYYRFLKKYGEQKAKQYALANETAIQEYRNLVKMRNIDCDFEERPSFVYSRTNAKLQQEAEAAEAVGLPASFTQDELLLPFPVWGAVRFARQAQFHPLKFIKNISEELRIYEQTPVRTVEEQTIITDFGTVNADKIVFACHYPFLNLPGLYLTRLHQDRSYVLALKNAEQLNGMYIGNTKSGYSFRNYGEYLLFGGQGHRAGKKTDMKKYEELRKEAKRFFPESEEICCWSAQDCITPDKIPYIGSYSKSRSNWYIATGFQKWGMTTSMAASLILRDLICDRNNFYADLFSPLRFSAENIPFIAKEGALSIKGLSKQVFHSPLKTVEDIKPGHGGVVMIGDRRAGVYKDEEGQIYAVDIRCRHLGCHLEWNPDEFSWDCPCHGSRFDYNGNLLNGPAQKNLERIELEEANEEPRDKMQK